MPNNPRCFVHKTVLDVTFRTEEGLPLVASEYMKVILRGIFARAQSLYPVTICHYLVMPNHVHMIIVVEDPEAVPGFIGAIKREISHAINRLAGRRKRTIWCDGYDAPVLLDPDKVVEKIAYIYSNPQKANLEETIERYPNFNSWQVFLTGGAEQKFRRIPRCCIAKLPKKELAVEDQRKFANKLMENSVFGGILYIEPDAWLQCFKETEDADPDRYRREVVNKVRAAERRFAKLRTCPVVGAEALCMQPIDRAYVPKKFGIRMICLSSFSELRTSFISWYKERCHEARNAFERRKLGDVLAKPPPGFFYPGGVLHANAIPAMIF